MGCVACNAEIHGECLHPDGIYCCCPPLPQEFVPTGLLELEPVGAEKTQGGYKQANDMIDPLSTGRKRAAELKPIREGMICEWSHLAKAGGGVYPIVGCLDSAAKHIHHGPDKNTTNNEPLNLHRVCSKCHNRWHSLNDKFYGNRPPAGFPFLPPLHYSYEHDPETKATTEKIVNHELWWTTKAKHRTASYDDIGSTGPARGLGVPGDNRTDEPSGSEEVDSDSDSPEVDA